MSGSQTLVLPQQVKTPRGSYLTLVEKELGEMNFGFYSLNSKLKRDIEEKAMFSVDSCQFTSLHMISPTLHCSNLLVVRGLLRRQSVREMIWTRSELEAVYWKHVSQMPPEFVVAGDVKRSTGGSITTSWNGYSATYRTGEWHALANDSIY